MIGIGIAFFLFFLWIVNPWSSSPEQSDNIPSSQNTVEE